MAWIEWDSWYDECELPPPVETGTINGVIGVALISAKRDSVWNERPPDGLEMYEITVGVACCETSLNLKIKPIKSPINKLNELMKIITNNIILVCNSGT